MVAPFDDREQHGFDWRAVLPEWVGKNGTAIVLMGDEPTQDTVLGDPNRSAETSTHGLAQYLNRRIRELPDGVEIAVESLPATDRGAWPRNRDEYTTKQSSARVRRVHGAKNLIFDAGKSNGRMAETGTVRLSDGVEIDWYLWEGDRPDRTNHAFTNGFVAALYDGELYDFSSAHSTFRQFGVSEQPVRDRTWLILRPPKLERGSGVYANSSRTRLLLMGGAHAGDALPLAEWGAEFARSMPEPIQNAIKLARTDRDGSLHDEAYRERLAERFGSRWKIPKWRYRATGTEPGFSDQPGSQPKQRPRVVRARPFRGGGAEGGTGGKQNTGSPAVGSGDLALTIALLGLISEEASPITRSGPTSRDPGASGVCPTRMRP